MAKSLIKIETPNLSASFSPTLLGESIKARRTQSGLRLEDAAGLAGVAKQTFMNLEHGSDKVTLANVLKVTDSLGIRLQILPWDNEDENEWE